MAGDAVGALDLVVFDCDGVLVNTEPTATRVLVAMLARVGMVMGEPECLRTFVGRSAATCLAMIAERRGAPLPAGFATDWDATLFAELGRGVAPVPGVVAALDAIEALSLSTCVASSGSHERMRITLGTSGLLPRFTGRIFSATEVARGKPFPDVFLHAAEQMGVAPARAVVVEDTPAGVTAAVAAGMTVFGYVGGDVADPRELAAAGARPFRSMSELPRLLGRVASPTRPTMLDTAGNGR